MADIFLPTTETPVLIVLEIKRRQQNPRNSKFTQIISVFSKMARVPRKEENIFSLYRSEEERVQELQLQQPLHQVPL